KQLGEARSAGAEAAERLANLKQTQEATLSALRWQGELKGLPAPQAVASFTATAKKLQDKLAELKREQEGYQKALAAAAEARKKLDALKDPFLGGAEEQGLSEKQKVIDELRKEAGLDRAAKEAGAAARAAPAPPAAPEKKPEPEKERTPPKKAEREKPPAPE